PSRRGRPPSQSGRISPARRPAGSCATGSPSASWPEAMRRAPLAGYLRGTWRGGSCPLPVPPADGWTSSRMVSESTGGKTGATMTATRVCIHGGTDLHETMTQFISVLAYKILESMPAVIVTGGFLHSNQKIPGRLHRRGGARGGGQVRERQEDRSEAVLRGVDSRAPVGQAAGREGGGPDDRRRRRHRGGHDRRNPARRASRDGPRHQHGGDDRGQAAHGGRGRAGPGSRYPRSSHPRRRW